MTRSLDPEDERVREDRLEQQGREDYHEAEREVRLGLRVDLEVDYHQRDQQRDLDGGEDDVEPDRRVGVEDGDPPEESGSLDSSGRVARSDRRTPEPGPTSSTTTTQSFPTVDFLGPTAG